ncbi:MAG: hypothetical protein AAFY38_16750 [Pseudomonadota bacterium]
MSGIGKRIDKALGDLEGGHFDDAAILIFAAIEATAKKRRPKLGNGQRFKSFVHDQQDIITAITWNIVNKDFTVRGVSLPEAIWKLARNPLTHEAELDRRMSFDNFDGTRISTGANENDASWEFPPIFLLGLAIAVVSARENMHEDVKLRGWFKFSSTTYVANSLWGAEEELRAIYRSSIAGKPRPKLVLLRETERQ